MINLRKSGQRGMTNNSWLKSYHSFSFGEYQDPTNQGFKSLRVLNEDIIEAGMGFDLHPHRNMEILTFVLSGELRHEDNLGNISTLKRGIIQKMSAGKGIFHSEKNASQNYPLHLIQIWITPNKTGLPPSYEETNLDLDEGLKLIAGPSSSSPPITINQDVKLFYLKSLDPLSMQLSSQKSYYLQALNGTFDTIIGSNTINISTGDALEVEALQGNFHCDFQVTKDKPFEALLFEFSS